MDTAVKRSALRASLPPLGLGCLWQIHSALNLFVLAILAQFAAWFLFQQTLVSTVRLKRQHLSPWQWRPSVSLKAFLLLCKPNGIRSNGLPWRFHSTTDKLGLSKESKKLHTLKNQLCGFWSSPPWLWIAPRAGESNPWHQEVTRQHLQVQNRAGRAVKSQIPIATLVPEGTEDLHYGTNNLGLNRYGRGNGVWGKNLAIPKDQVYSSHLHSWQGI